MAAGRGKRKRVQAQLRTNIPLDGDSLVTRVEVTRDTKQRILAQSRTVSVPVTDLPPVQGMSSEALDSLVSTIEDPPDPVTKKARKGPSRSVAVCPNFVATIYLVCTHS